MLHLLANVNLYHHHFQALLLSGRVNMFVKKTWPDFLRGYTQKRRLVDVQ